MPPTQSPEPPQRRRRRTLGTIAPEVEKQQAKEAAAAQSKRANQENKKRFLESLRANAGLISFAARATSIDFAVYRIWMSSDPDFRDKVEEIMQFQVDSVEAALLKKICPPANSGERPDTKAICFYLASKGARNGYSRAVRDPLAVETLTPAVIANSTSEDDEPYEMDEGALAKAVEILSSRVKIIEVETVA